MKELYDANPCKKRAERLCRKTDIGLLNSANYLIDKMEHSFIDNTTALARKVDEARAYLTEREENRLSGVFYSAYSILEDAAKSGSLSKIRDALDSFDDLTVKHDSLRIASLGDGFFSEKDENILVDFIRNEQDPDGKHLRVATKCTQSSSEYSKLELNKAIEAIKSLNKNLYEETLCHITDILIVNSNRINAASSFKSFGVVFLRELEPEQNWTTYLEHLVHESAHHLVFSIWHSIRLIDQDKGRLLSSPLRPDPRPISAVYHAAAVLSRIIFVLGLAYDSDKYTSIKRTARYNFSNTSSLLEQFCDAYNVIKENAVLTGIGERLLENFKILAVSYNRESTLFVGREVSLNHE